MGRGQQVSWKPSKWDLRFLELAALVSTWSKDTTKVGCVIVGPDREVRGVGYNGFPRGVDDDVPERKQRPAKYLWTAHAERNALDNALRAGISVRGCTLYLTWMPCMDCARGIIQTGIAKVIAGQGSVSDNPEKWAEHFRCLGEIFAEGGVKFETINKD